MVADEFAYSTCRHFTAFDGDAQSYARRSSASKNANTSMPLTRHLVRRRTTSSLVTVARQVRNAGSILPGGVGQRRRELYTAFPVPSAQGKLRRRSKVAAPDFQRPVAKRGQACRRSAPSHSVRMRVASLQRLVGIAAGMVSVTPFFFKLDGVAHAP